jgi:serine/threonine protein phosphatase 1
VTLQPRTIAIGDIHGCAHALEALLGEINPGPGDTIVCLGDFIDTGRDTEQVIRLLMGLDERGQLVYLLGNHEEMLLSSLADPKLEEGWMVCGGQATVNSYKFCGTVADIPADHVAFIRACREYWETPHHLFTHANFDPDLSLAAMPPYTLRWSPLDEPQYRPHQSGKKVLVGHTEQRSGEILDLGSVMCIDTYCHAYGWLTAIDVNSGQVWQASRWGLLREGEDLANLQRAKEMLQVAAG